MAGVRVPHPPYDEEAAGNGLASGAGRAVVALGLALGCTGPARWTGAMEVAMASAVGGGRVLLGAAVVGRVAMRRGGTSPPRVVGIALLSWRCEGWGGGRGAPQ